MFSWFNPAALWFKLATYVVAAGAGAALCVYVYARPEIQARDLTIVQMTAASVTNHDKFTTEAAAKQQENERNERAIEAKAEVAKSRTEARIAELDAGNRLRDQQIATYVSAAHSPGLPSASGSGCTADDPAATLGNLLGQSDDLSQSLAADAERLADQVRALQEVIKADRRSEP